MLFNSLAYAIFLPIVFTLYWLLPHRYRWMLLFIASYYFYMSWNVKYVALILFTTAVSYSAAILMEKYEKKEHRRAVLAVTAVLCLGMLFFFKYFNFASETVSGMMSVFSIRLSPLTLNLLLPVGISFYTFQTLSYVIDVYRGDVKAEHHFGYYATFISFFPQLVAGPIERTENLLPQIKAEHSFDYAQSVYGLKLMVWGYFKKLVIADTLSRHVSIVYSAPQCFKGFTLVLATFYFAIQIYCDFSGYSDIAIGTAKLMGINLMTNFRSPYLSQSIKEYWVRWHISLSTWFRDYVYIPLGGSRCSRVRHYFNLMLTFLASGLWHGADWTYVIWGGLHGIFQIIETIIFGKSKPEKNGIVKWLRIVVTFAMILFTLIFFVSNSVSDALYVVWHLFDGIGSPVSYLREGISVLGISKYMIFALLLLLAYDCRSLKHDCIEDSCAIPLVPRYAFYMFILCFIMFFKSSAPAEFVYFQF